MRAQSPKDTDEPVEFNITEESDTIAFTRDLVDAGFKAKCIFSKRAFALGGYLQGSFVLEKRAMIPIKSVDIRISRMETFRLNEQTVSDDSDVVVLQVADGDLDAGIEVPVHILIPRLYVCPSTDTPVRLPENNMCTYEVTVVLIALLLSSCFPRFLCRSLE